MTSAATLQPPVREVIIVGGGLAGLSAAIYLGRAQRDTLIIDSGRSLALWEPEVQNYLGFPEGISGEELLQRGLRQAMAYQAEIVKDQVVEIRRAGDLFRVLGERGSYAARRLLLATGLYHLPPDLPGISECIGHSIFFCKDCDAYRVQDRQIAIMGWNDDAVELALGMLKFTASLAILANGHAPRWSPRHQAWLEEYAIPVKLGKVTAVKQSDSQIRALTFDDGSELTLECLFTTRGDVYHNQLAEDLGAEIDEEGQVLVNDKMRTSVPGLYAAGCLTPANCQMIIAAGQGATAGQAINRDLFEESLANHKLLRHRQAQLREEPDAQMALRPDS